MNIHDATETAYRNGYEDGKKEVAKVILSDLKKAVHNKAIYSRSAGIPHCIPLKVFDAIVNDFVKRYTGGESRE